LLKLGAALKTLNLGNPEHHRELNLLLIACDGALLAAHKSELYGGSVLFLIVRVFLYLSLCLLLLMFMVVVLVLVLLLVVGPCIFKDFGRLLWGVFLILRSGFLLLIMLVGVIVC
jgi:hypothetical protein